MPTNDKSKRADIDLPKMSVENPADIFSELFKNLSNVVIEKLKEAKFGDALQSDKSALARSRKDDGESDDDSDDDSTEDSDNDSDHDEIKPVLIALNSTKLMAKKSNEEEEIINVEEIERKIKESLNQTKLTEAELKQFKEKFVKSHEDFKKNFKGNMKDLQQELAEYTNEIKL